jgi:hypothetical protein
MRFRINKLMEAFDRFSKFREKFVLYVLNICTKATSNGIIYIEVRGITFLFI